MAKYKIPRDPVLRDFTVVKTVDGTYICPLWILVDDGTTRDDVEFLDDIQIDPDMAAAEVTEGAKNDTEYTIPSSNGKTTYRITFKKGQWNCNCPAKSFRRGHCKHIKHFETIQEKKV